MLLVILGAGASFDSAPHLPPPRRMDHPWRPPLADHLFADRPGFKEEMEKFPRCLGIISRLMHRPEGETVEHTLERLQSEPHPLRPSQIAAVKFYLYTMLWRCQTEWKRAVNSITNYHGLLDAIEEFRFRGTQDDLQRI